ncbi:MAG: hypothetical protein OEY86_00590 [Nitrospira sp.]|nr:hypothetical protein [Nitrospira sp.]
MQQMKVSGLVLVYVLVLTGVAGATIQYQPVMSKDDKLCETVRSQLNHDMREYDGEIRFRTHQMTPVIDWRPMPKIQDWFSEYGECELVRWAQFDLNNDGTIDVVVKRSLCWNSPEGWDTTRQYFWMFDGAYVGYKSARTFSDIYEQHGNVGTGLLDLPGYYLRNLPDSNMDLRLDERNDAPVFITPFRFQDATYLHVDHQVPSNMGITVHIVAKYMREVLPPRNVKKTPGGRLPKHWLEGLEDICYFMAEVPKRRPLERLEDGYILRH